MRIGVIGPGAPHADHADIELAEQVGHLLGESGATVICGGLGGVMEAACRGAAARGTITVGFLPGRDDGDPGSHSKPVMPRHRP